MVWSKALGHFCFWIFGFFLLYCFFLLFFIWRFCGELGVALDVGVGVRVGSPLTKRHSAGIWLTIGVRSGPIGGHAKAPHHDGLPAKYKLSGIVWSKIVGSQTVELLA